MERELQEGRETTIEERQVWGTCPVCKAGPGEWCHAEVGVQLGIRADGQRMQTGDGAHLARLRTAPMRVKVVEWTP